MLNCVEQIQMRKCKTCTMKIRPPDQYICRNIIIPLLKNLQMYRSYDKTP